MRTNKKNSSNIFDINEINAFSILKGPDKFNFTIGFLSGNEIKFIIRGYKGLIRIGGHETKKIIKVRIASLARKNQSGDDWLFEGKDSKGRRVEGYYNTSIYSGFLDFEDVGVGHIF